MNGINQRVIMVMRMMQQGFVMEGARDGGPFWKEASSEWRPET